MMCGGFFCVWSILVAAAFWLAGSPSQSNPTDLPAPPKWEPLAVHANFTSLPRPLPLGEVDLRSKDGEGEAAALARYPFFLSLPPAICAIVTSFREKVSPSRWRTAKAGRGRKELLHRIIFYRKYGKNLLQIDNKRCIIYKWLWKPDTSSADRDFLPVLRILCRRR